MNYLMLPGRSLFICDTHVNENPSAEEIAEMTIMGPPGDCAVTPAHAGVQLWMLTDWKESWIPAFAGMTPSSGRVRQPHEK